MPTPEELQAELDRLRGDFSKITNDLNAANGRVRKFEEERTQYEQWYQQANAEYTRMQQQAEDYARRVQAFQQAANPQPPQPPSPVAPNLVTKEDLLAQITELRNSTANVLKDLGSVLPRHVRQFGDVPFDADAILKVAEEKRLPSLESAWKEWIRPEEEKRTQAAFEERIKREREEAIRDFASRNQLPTSRTEEVSPLYRKHDPASAPKDLDQELLSAWNSVTP